jgi:plasmid stability protein
MAALTVRKIPEETHRAIKQRAKQNGRSAEAEIRALIEETYRPKERVKLGTWLHERAMEFGGFKLDIERDKTPAGTVSFE